MPILNETGMKLVSTSINRFQPIESLPALFAEEKKYYEMGARAAAGEPILHRLLRFPCAEAEGDSGTGVPMHGL